MSPGKVEHERARYQGHGDRLQVVVVIQKARDPASANGFDPVCREAQVDVPFADIVGQVPKRFDGCPGGRRPAFRLTVGNEYDTMNSESELFAQYPSVSSGVCLGAAQRFVVNAHEHRQPEPRRLLRRRSHAPIGRRARLPDRAARSRLHHLGPAARSAPRVRRDCSIDRRTRPPLARPLARRHRCGQIRNTNHRLPLVENCVGLACRARPESRSSRPSAGGNLD